MNKLIILSFVLTSILTFKETNIMQKNSTITVVKFMYLDDYPMAIDTKSFWKFPNEHAKFILPLGKNSFLDEIKTLPTNKCDSLTFLNYAFIVKTKKGQKDTIYSDFALKTWIFKQKEKSICCYDEKGRYSEFLRQNFPFFKDCW